MKSLRKFIKICHWLLTGFHLIVIYYGLKTALQNLETIQMERQHLDYAVRLVKTSLWLYVSLWGLAMHIAYFTMVTLLEVFDSVPSLSKMTAVINWVENVRRHFFVSLVFPITLCVGSAFWVVYAYDREQIYPSMLDAYMPKWINHAVHTIPPIVAFFHIFIADLNGISTKPCIAVLIGFNVLYNLCFIWSGLVNGNWVYLMCDALSGMKLALSMSMCNLSTGLYFAFVMFSRPYTKRIREFVMCENTKKKVN